MEKLKYTSTFDTQYPNVFIDSGGTHHLFHKRSSFDSYEVMSDEKKKGAICFAAIVGSGRFILSIDVGTAVYVYHYPRFSSNVISVGKLWYLFDICFNYEVTGEDKKTSL